MTKIALRDTLAEHGLPSAPEVERLVAASILNHHEETWAEASGTITDADFTTEAYRRVWRTVAALAGRGEVVDVTTVAESLKESRQLDSVGGLGGLMDLGDGIPQIVSIAGYCKILRKKSFERLMVLRGRELADRAVAGLLTPEEIASWAERITSESRTSDEAHNWQRPGDVIAADLEAFFDPSSRYNAGVWLPWRSLRSLIPGLLPGTLTLLAARPAVGKSSMGFQIAYETAKRGLPVAAFSLEMASRDLVGRIACGVAQIDSSSWQRGLLGESELGALRRASSAIAELPLFLNDTSTATVPGVLTAMDRLPIKPRLVVVDYLQLLTAPGENRTQQISQISRRLKLAAMQLGIPFLVLSQLTRDNQRANRAPELSDLRDSGSLEQDADTVICLHPKSTDPDELITDVQVLVRKQRNGPVGARTLAFHRGHTWFTEEDLQ